MTELRAFQDDQFLNQFRSHLGVLRDFVALWRGRITQLDLDNFTLDAFKSWVAESRDEGIDNMRTILDHARELCTDNGEEHLREACDYADRTPDHARALPVACLALHVFTLNPLIFRVAYDNDLRLRVGLRSIFGEGGFQRLPVALARSVATTAHRANNDVMGLLLADNPRPAGAPTPAGSPSSDGERKPAAEQKPDGVYGRDLIVGGVKYRLEFTKREMDFLILALVKTTVPIADLWHRGPNALWKRKYVNTRKNRNLVFRFLSKLNTKLAKQVKPAFPFFFMIPRSEEVIIRTTAFGD